MISIAVIVLHYNWNIKFCIIKNFSGEVRTRLISQLVNGNSRVAQNLLRYFNGAILWTFFVQSFSILPVIFLVNLNEALLLPSTGKLITTQSFFKNASSL